jgi:lysophospholipase L1-like esterase
MTTRRVRAAVACVLLSGVVACSSEGPTGPTPVSPSGRLLPPSPRLSRTRILAFGDSLTAGVTSTPVLSALGVGVPVSYPARLQSLIAARYYDQAVLVENAGRTGEVAEDAIPRLRAALPSFAPDVIVLLHGVNDVVIEGLRGVNRNLPFMTTLVRDAKQSGADVFLCTLLPQRPGGSRAGDPAAISAFNAALRTLARAENVMLIDLAAAFGGIGLIGADGLHPIEAGYERLATLILQAVREQFERPPSLH